MPEKFPETGINVLAADGGVYTPAQWPGAVEFVNSNVRNSREAAFEGVASIALSERQLFVMNSLAIPAIKDTLKEVLGTEEHVDVPGITFVSILSSKDFETYLGTPGKTAAGVYYSHRNQIVINQGNHTSDSPEDLAYFTKIFIHEFFHYLSHQFSELDRPHSRLAIQRVGMLALGEDIREAHEGELTWDYFVASNEANTEMLAIQAYQKIAQDTVFKMPDGTPAKPFESYPDYRSLQDAVAEDAIRYASTDLPETELWHFVCRGYITGSLKPLIALVHTTYPGLSMREFGLMTSSGDLPRESDFVWQRPNDGGSRTLSETYLARLRARLNGKTSRDYITDVVPPPPPPPSASVSVYTEQIRVHQRGKMQAARLALNSQGIFVDRSGAAIASDEHGNIIHYDQTWLVGVLELMIDVGVRFRNGTVSADQAGQAIDQTLFNQLHVSELSSGFEEFFVAKHQLLDPSTSAEQFSAVLKNSRRKISRLRGDK